MIKTKVDIGLLVSCEEERLSDQSTPKMPT